MKTKVFQLLSQAFGTPNLAKKTIDTLFKLLELRSQNGVELHGEHVRKKG